MFIFDLLIFIFAYVIQLINASKYSVGNFKDIAVQHSNKFVKVNG